MTRILLAVTILALGVTLGCTQLKPPDAAAKNVKVAAIQFRSMMGQPELNRRRAMTYIREAAAHGAKVVVLPETAITGYMSYDLRTTWQKTDGVLNEGLRGLSPYGAAETVPGPSTEALRHLAAELRIYLTIPLVEIDRKTGRLFNTVVLADPTGSMPLHYRKLNPWPFPEQSWATAGDHGHQYLDTPYGRLGLLICYDINFEPVHLAESKVDLLLYPIAWVDKKDSDWFSLRLPKIARENHLYIIGANWTVPGPAPEWEGYGHSLIISNDGQIRAKVSADIGEEIVYAFLPLRTDG